MGTDGKDQPHGGGRVGDGAPRSLLDVLHGGPLIPVWRVPCPVLITGLYTQRMVF